MWYKQSRSKFNVSISGWRAIFNAVDDSTSLTIDDLMMFYAAIRSYLYAKLKISNLSPDNMSALRIVIGRDSRPSGVILLELARKTLARYHIDIIDLRIVPLPVIMAYTKNNTDGFIYFTASHNPPEYNGIKFGSKEGKIQSREEHKKLLQIFYDYSDDHPEISSTVQEIWKKFHTHRAFDFSHAHTIQETELYNRAYEDYKTLIYSGVFRGVENPVEEIKKRTAHALSHYNTARHDHKTSIGVVFDPNGGARTCNIDKKILEELGIHTKHINTTPGKFKHAIIPEGESLFQASETLKTLNKDGATYWIAAIVCDCDGDRGNLVFADAGLPSDDTLELKAQEVFSLVLKIELAWETYIKSSDSNNAPLAVVVNGASSLRCDIIASEYNAKVFRSEVGEANVVALSETLRSQHYAVPIVGEASNGGIIIPPSNVRDPLCTVLSILKSLLWAEEMKLKNDITGIIKTLPVSISSTTEDPQAKVSLPHEHYSTIAQKIITHFKEYAPYFYEILEANDVHAQDYAFMNFSETESIPLDAENPQVVISGGLAVYFYNAPRSAKRQPIAFLWLRPSGTEPVVRIMVDVLHNNSTTLQRYLLEAWLDYLEEVLFLKTQQ